MRRTARATKPQPVPAETDGRYCDWPRTELRHLIAGLPARPLDGRRKAVPTKTRKR